MVSDNVMGGNDPGFTFDALATGNSTFRLDLEGNSNDDVYLLSTFAFNGFMKASRVKVASRSQQ